MKLYGTDKHIIEEIALRHAEAAQSIARARERVPKTKREIEPFQAMALYALARPYNFEGSRILEIGTAYGYSAAVLAEAAPLAQIVTLNPQEHEVIKARENLKDYNNVAVYQAKSWDYLPEAIDTKLRVDMIFVDGDHKRVKHDLPFWDLLKPGGLLVFHDYSPAGSRRECPPVFEAVNEWVAGMNRTLDVVVMDEDNVGMAGLYKPLNVATSYTQASYLGVCKRYSMNSDPHLSALFTLSSQVQAEGAIVECGVTRGGSLGALVLGAQAAGHDRPVYAFDTFAGMPRPGGHDDPKIHDLWKMRDQGRSWCVGSMDDVLTLFSELGVQETPTFGVGDFAQSFNRTDLPHVAVLHVDATLHDSTLVALINFAPLLSPDALVIVSAFHYWHGIQRAVESYWRVLEMKPPRLTTFDGQHVFWRVPRD